MHITSNRIQLITDEKKIKKILNQQKKFENSTNYNLKFYRLVYGYSQESLAKILGISIHSYRHKENRTHGQEFTESEIRILHELLRIPYNAFFEYMNEKKANDLYDLTPLKRR